MNEKQKAAGWIKNTLNSYAQNGVSKIHKKDLAPHLNFGYHSTDFGTSIHVILSWEEITEVLVKLENECILKIVQDLTQASENDVCVIMKSFTSGTPFPDGWIRD